MSTEIVTPFSLDANGNVLVTTDPDLQIEQHLISLVSTDPGERVMLPNYGVPTDSYLFSINSDSAQEQILNAVTAAVGVWEPSVTVSDISFGGNQDPDDSSLQIEIDWEGGGIGSSSASSGVQTATVLVGGTVIEDN
jgi:hypothetical protein